jgi:hypothetical protein
MKRTHRILVVVTCACALLSVAGCPTSPERTSNQGGGSLLSAGAKIANGQLASLTPDEVQILADMLSAQDPNIELVVSDEDAQAAVEFLQLNEINTIEDLERVASDADQDPNSVIIPDGVLAIFGARIVAPISQR